LDGNGAGERGEWLPIFGKAETLGESDPDCLIQAVGSGAGGSKGAALAEAM
jgi:hypothetical protein